MELLDNMLETGRLEGFVSEIIKTVNEELEEKTLWEYWLHKVWNMDWPDYYASRNDKSSTTEAAPPEEELKDTVSFSAQMLMGFCPDSGGEQDGTVQTDGNDSG
jgi:hypothetical protein